MFCEKCGAKLPDEGRFCHICGTERTFHVEEEEIVEVDQEEDIVSAEETIEDTTVEKKLSKSFWVFITLLILASIVFVGASVSSNDTAAEPTFGAEQDAMVPVDKNWAAYQEYLLANFGALTNDGQDHLAFSIEVENLTRWEDIDLTSYPWDDLFADIGLSTWWEFDSGIIKAPFGASGIYTKEAAQEQGGFYILEDGKFYSLATSYFISEYNDEFATLTNTGLELPILDESAQLVWFTDSSVENVGIAGMMAQGATIPLLFSAPRDKSEYEIEDALFYNNVYPTVVNAFANIASSDVWNSTVDSWELVQANTYDVELAEIRNTLIDEISSMVQIPGCGMLYAEYYLLACAPKELVPVGFYIGSSWHEMTLPACIDYRSFTESVITPLERTKDGYYLIHVDNLSSGTYALIENTYSFSFSDEGTEIPLFTIG